MAAQAFQVCQRLLDQPDMLYQEWLEQGGVLAPLQTFREKLDAWREHTTTIARVAKTTAMFERVCAEVPGVVMVDEGFTEVEPDTPTVFASWPAPRTAENKLLGNAKVQLLRDAPQPFSAWTDEQIQNAAAAFESASGEGAFGDASIADALRAEAASRHLKLPQAYGGENIDPERWDISR